MFNLLNVNGNLMACYGLNITLLYYSDIILQWHAYVITKEFRNRFERECVAAWRSWQLRCLLRPYGPEFEPPPHLPHARYVPLLRW